MKALIKYFLKDYNFNTNVESIRTRTFLLFLLVGSSLLIAFMVNTVISGDFNSLPVQSAFLLIILTCLFLMKTGKQQIVGNSLSIIVVLVEIASIFMNFSGAASYNFFVDEFYLLLAFLLFTAMFASKIVFYFNTILIIAVSIIAFIYTRNSFPPEIINEFRKGLNVYVFVIILVSFFSFLYTSIVINAIKEISDHAEDSDEKNIQLKEKTELLKNQKNELKMAKEKAEESDNLKSTFLANMSHEIRTPMNAILGFTEILKDTNITEKQTEYINIIETSGNHLLELINDIIDISKLESNELKVEETKCNLNKFIDDILTFFELSQQKNHKDNIRLIKNFGLEQGKDVILTDTTRLKQILFNLIGNALKFTLSGTIEVCYILQQNNQLLFKVKDTGIGIPESQISIIFERFRQADETTTKLYGGTGLGLAISKACAKLLGGEIWAESEENKGSTFYFTISYKPIG